MITVGVIVWVADLLRRLVGRGTVIGEALRSVGLRFAADDTIAYLTGIVLVVAIIFAIGVVVESGARSLFQRLSDALLARIPLVGNIYGTSKQLIAMLDKKDDSKLQGMKAVFCSFGKESGAGVLALLVSPERFRICGRDYHIVIVPTAPVPIGGGLLFLPAEAVAPTDLTIESLMSIYVSMGVTAPQFLPATESA